MTLPRTIGDYGGPFVDALVVENPTTEQSADFANRDFADLAQLTNTPIKVWVRFALSTGGAGAITPIFGRSHMGVGSGELPTIAKLATGSYTITYPATWTDVLGVVETIGFYFSFASVHDLSIAGHLQTTGNLDNIISLKAFDMAGSASDLTGVIVTVFAG